MTNANWKKRTLHRCCIGVMLLNGLLSSMLRAQDFQVIHTFTGLGDGLLPMAGLTVDRSGNLYGTAWGGVDGNGTVFRMKRSEAGWIFDVIHAFKGSPGDGAAPAGRVIFGPDGALYGTTSQGGIVGSCVPQGEESGCGTVYRLRPHATICAAVSCPWTEDVLYIFQGGLDGLFPYGEVTFDSRGSIYGTTSSGGDVSSPQQTCLQRWDGGCGTVYELSPAGAGWTHRVLYRFQGTLDNYIDGAAPLSGVTLDSAGNLFGTTPSGGEGVDIGQFNYGYGVVYELSPGPSGWTETVIHLFTNDSDGSNPIGGLIFDASGNLLGTAVHPGTNGGGTAFGLTNANGQWNLNWLTDFGSSSSAAALTVDTSGNLYGTTVYGGVYGQGTVFKLIPSSGGWTYQDLHDFSGADGANPSSTVALDAHGNLFGTAEWGGGDGLGVVWEIADQTQEKPQASVLFSGERERRFASVPFPGVDMTQLSKKVRWLLNNIERSANLHSYARTLNRSHQVNARAPATLPCLSIS